MKLRTGMFIKHKDAMDVCIRLTNVFDYGHGVSIKGDWWNMAFVTSFPIGYGYNQRINFRKDDTPSKAKKLNISDWYVANPVECMRNADWRPIGGI